MLSVVILTKNEEANIGRCLESLRWCNEIVVIVDKSADKTVQIARKLKAKVIDHPLNNDFAQQRNFALRHVRGKWVLFVDADEVVSQKLAEEIKLKISQPSGAGDKTTGFYLKRLDFFLGKWLKYGEVGNLKILRLAKKDAGQWERSVDEVWKISGPTEILQNPLDHYSHPDLTQFLKSINLRSTLNAQWLFDNGEKLTAFEWAKPLVKFIDNYFLKFGFMDGIHGFVFAVLMSFHSFLVRGKLYLLLAKAQKAK